MSKLVNNHRTEGGNKQSIVAGDIHSLFIESQYNHHLSTHPHLHRWEGSSIKDTQEKEANKASLGLGWLTNVKKEPLMVFRIHVIHQQSRSSIALYVYQIPDPTARHPTPQIPAQTSGALSYDLQDEPFPPKEYPESAGKQVCSYDLQYDDSESTESDGEEDDSWSGKDEDYGSSDSDSYSDSLQEISAEAWNEATESAKKRVKYESGPSNYMDKDQRCLVTRHREKQ